MLASCAAAALTFPLTGQAARDASTSIQDVRADGKRFLDLNRNGRLDRYEDWRLTAEDRADDLLRQLTLEEKAGAMVHGTLPGDASTSQGRAGLSPSGYDLVRAKELIIGRGVTSFITRLSIKPAALAEQNNAVQAIARSSRLGIPVTISTDPRNHFNYLHGATVQSNGFSQWPDAIGFGALRDPVLVRQFADIARQEYRAVGIHVALSPQADLATEPRWPRIAGTFGSSANIVGPLVKAYVEGFQGGANGLAQNGVLAVVKHWVGYGAQPEGFDGHNAYGRTATLDNPSLREHVAAFRGAFAAQVGGVMPAYPILEGVTIGGRPLEQVGPGFNRTLLSEVLRGEYGFDGIILSDWAITEDCTAECEAPTRPQGPAEIGMPWGVERLSRQQRFEKGILAGIDQFGGVDDPQAIVAAVRAGRLNEERLDRSVRKVMIAKFRQGLFDNPYVDAAAAARLVGTAGFQHLADVTQRRAQVLLQNRGGLLPLRRAGKVFLHGISKDAAEAAGLQPVSRIEDAEVAIFRLVAPSEKLHPHHFFGNRQKEGRLDFRDGDPDYEALKVAAAKVPVIASVYLDRPAILANVRDKAEALLGNFGASDSALLDVILGRSNAEGRLPFELPASMRAVEAQHPAKPDDSPRPLYPVGHGIISERK